MAQLQLIKRSVVFYVQAGVDFRGNPVRKNLTYTGMKDTATVDGLYTFSQGIMELLSPEVYTVIAIYAVDKGELTQ